MPPNDLPRAMAGSSTRGRAVRACQIGGFAVACALAGCGNKDSVTLSGRIDSLDLAVDETALGTFLRGDFELVVALGSYAGDPVSVRTATFALLRSDSRETLGAGPLDVRPVPEGLPRDVGPGDEVRVAYELVADNPLGTDIGVLCGGEVMVRGAVEHSLAGGSTTTVDSPPVTPSGCD